nr:CsbD family protein [Microvirga massiliensis]
MDHDRVAGSAEQAKGAVKEGVGSLIGDSKLQAEGRADKVEGKAQNTLGGIKDMLRGK